MHRIIQNGLEEFLGGQVRREFQTHLDECEECRVEVREFKELSGMFSALKVAEPVMPGPSFYARLSQTIEREQQPSLWSLFSVHAAFGRRLAFASLMTLAIVGGVLVSEESAPEVSDAAMASPDVIVSHDFLASHSAASDRDRIMTALVSYDK